MITLRDLETNIDGQNYLLRCTDGIFSGKFLFINTTPEGEIFGSGDPELNQDITMYIESANLAERHADIKFLELNGSTSNGHHLQQHQHQNQNHLTNTTFSSFYQSFASSMAGDSEYSEFNDFSRNGNYILTDLSGAEPDKGTWVRIPSSFAKTQNSALINLHTIEAYATQKVQA